MTRVGFVRRSCATICAVRRAAAAGSGWMMTSTRRRVCVWPPAFQAGLSFSLHRDRDHLNARFGQESGSKLRAVQTLRANQNGRGNRQPDDIVLAREVGRTFTLSL